MAKRNTTSPRQTITSLAVNLERCFKRVEDIESVSHTLRSMVESTNKLVLDLDRKVAEAMNLASSASMARHVDVAETAGKAFDEKRTYPWRVAYNGSPEVENLGTKKFAVRFASGSGEKMKIVEACHWRQSEGIVEFYRDGKVFAVSSGHFISAEVVD